MTQDEAVTAMCLWEAWLEIRNTSTPGDLVAEEMERLQGEHGVASIREVVLGLVPACELAWKAAHALGYDDCFDWEFCPDFLRGVVERGQLLETSFLMWGTPTRDMVAGDIGL